MLVFTAMGCGLNSSCKRRQDETEMASTKNIPASSVLAQRPMSRPTCMNCILIEMGEMVSDSFKSLGNAQYVLIFGKVCYTDKCPDCGRQPPGSVKMRLHQDPDSINMIDHQDPGSIKMRNNKMIQSLAEVKIVRTATSREDKENTTQSFQTNYFVV